MIKQYKDTFSDELVTATQCKDGKWSVTYPAPNPNFKTLTVNVSNKSFKEHFISIN